MARAIPRNDRLARLHEFRAQSLRDLVEAALAAARDPVPAAPVAAPRVHPDTGVAPPAPQGAGVLKT